MFTDCNNLTTVGDLSNWNVSKAYDISHMFHNNYNLTTVGDLSNWNVSNVVDMSFLFYFCKSITELNVSDWDVSKVGNL